MKAFILLMGLTIGMQANAGLFGSDEPPKDFLSGNISVTMGLNNLQPLGFTVQQLTDAYKADKHDWAKDSAAWIFKVHRADKMTGKKVEIAMQFQVGTDHKAVISKWVIDGEYLTPEMISGMLYRTQSDMLAAGIIKMETAPLNPRKPANKRK